MLPSGCRDLPRDPRSYLLSQHAYVCATHDGVVFLDLRRDKYLGLGGAQAHALSSVVQGLPEYRGSTTVEVEKAYATDVAELLIAEGLLTRDPVLGKSAAPVKLTAERSLVALGEDLERPRKIRSAEAGRFLVACVSTTCLLRTHSMFKVVQHVTARTDRLATYATTFDPDRTAELVSIFRRLRTYLFTARGHCLFHALALRHFLASNGVFASWVVGVRTSPFAAHSWLQLNHYVMDATPEEISPFTPILVV
jgi:Transglutaminase-like superfamily